MWKRLPYWVRGALIAETVVILTHIYYFACIKSSNSEGEAIGCYITTLPITFPTIIEETMPISENFAIFLVFFTWFLLGSLIGLIVGKFKKKSLPPTSQI